ncbi:UNVERIFIED_CONTAM: hypothetical protein GTU68_023762 [Idotea baltica]|nr:hypothetical protein [Idotea baltica]
MVTAAILVFFMQVGFCMLEMGLVRSKNCINVAMKNALDFSAVVITFLLFGFTFMFGASDGGIFGTENFQIWNFSGNSEIWSFWFFQVVFAATACTIASGAMAERTKFIGYLIYTVILSGLIYPVFGHWVWGSLGGGFEEGFGGSAGWLENIGFRDFAGSTVVHGIGGASALAGIIVLGPRVGRFLKDGTPRYIPGHNLPLVAFGALILWVGWFGFNAGSSVQGSAELGRICANTAVAGGAGAIVAMSFFWLLRGTPNVLIAINGILGGLVGITANCDVVTPVSAVLIGAIAGIISTAGTLLLERMKLDDVVGAVPVHLFNGIWGTLCVGIFIEPSKYLEIYGKTADLSARFNLIGIQLFGTIAVCAGAFLVAFVLFKVIDTLIGLRANEDDQEDGLDFAEHSANAYPDFKTTDH